MIFSFSKLFSTLFMTSIGGVGTYGIYVFMWGDTVSKNNFLIQVSSDGKTTGYDDEKLYIDNGDEYEQPQKNYKCYMLDSAGNNIFDDECTVFGFTKPTNNQILPSHVTSNNWELEKKEQFVNDSYFKLETTPNVFKSNSSNWSDIYILPKSVSSKTKPDLSQYFAKAKIIYEIEIDSKKSKAKGKYNFILGAFDIATDQTITASTSFKCKKVNKNANFYKQCDVYSFSNNEKDKLTSSLQAGTHIDFSSAKKVITDSASLKLKKDSIYLIHLNQSKYSLDSGKGIVLEVEINPASTDSVDKVDQSTTKKIVKFIPIITMIGDIKDSKPIVAFLN